MTNPTTEPQPDQPDLQAFQRTRSTISPAEGTAGFEMPPLSTPKKKRNKT